MSLSDRRSFLGLLALPALTLAGCGFSPVYGTGGAGAELLERVRVADPSDRNGFYLVERIEERLGRTRTPLYRMTYDIETESNGLAYTTDNSITRYNIDGRVRYTLTDETGRVILTSGTVRNFVSYSASGTTISTLSAEEDAYERLMRLLADQIVIELIASSATWKRAVPAATAAATP